MKSFQYVLLVADDSSAERKIICKAAEQSDFNFQIECVEDGIELVDFLLRRARYEERDLASDPDLLLLDLNMPKMNGVEALQLLAKYPRVRTFDTVILTTSSSTEDMYDTFGLGVNSFLTKPDSFAELVQMMNELGQQLDEKFKAQ